MSRSNMLTTGSHRSVKSFSEISKVSLDAYNKVWEDILRRKQEEKKAELAQLQLNQVQEATETEKKTRAKLSALRYQEEIAKQIQETKGKKSLEKNVDREKFNEVVNNMAEDVVTLFPRITETPAAIRRAKKAAVQNSLKAELQSQIGAKTNEKTQGKKAEAEQELAAIRVEQTLATIEDEQKNCGRKELMKKYQSELMREMQFKTIQKLAEKTADERELERLLQAKDLLSPRFEDELSPSRVSESLRKNSLGSYALSSRMKMGSPLSPARNDNSPKEFPKDTESVCHLNDLKPLLTEESYKKLSQGKSEEPPVEEKKVPEEKTVDENPAPQNVPTASEPKKEVPQKMTKTATDRLKEKEKILQQQRMMRVKMLREQLFKKEAEKNPGAEFVKATSTSPAKRREAAGGSIWNAPLRAEEPRLYKLNAAHILANRVGYNSGAGDKSVRAASHEKYAAKMVARKEVAPPVRLPEVVRDVSAPRVDLSPQRVIQASNLGAVANSPTFFITNELD